jgi:hypothetical protein
VTQTIAWKIKHKLMFERDATKRLTGRIEIDDAYLGGERHGGKRGRGAPGKTPFIAAVETRTCTFGCRTTCRTCRAGLSWRRPCVTHCAIGTG